MKHAKNLLALFMAVVLLVGCGKQESDVSAPPVEGTDGAESVMEINEALANIWDLMDNEAVEEEEILPGLILDDLDALTERMGFTEITLYQRANVESIRVGVVGDAIVATLCMGDDDVLWNVRMEKAEAQENRVAVELPADTEVVSWTNQDPRFPITSYHYEYEKFKFIAIYTAYFEDTKNLYTFYSNDVITKYDGDTLNEGATVTYTNITQMPFATLTNIPDESEKYKMPGDEQMQRAKQTKNIQYFRIVTDEAKVYQYRLGMKLGEWVESAYNTDGWKISENSDLMIISPDGRYKLSADAYCWREMTASQCE